MLFALLKIKFMMLFIITYGTLSFPMVGAAVPDAKRFSELEHLAIDELLQHWHRAILIQHKE